MTDAIEYDNYLVESLKDPEEAVGYLNAALGDGDIDVFLLALRNVAKAQGGIGILATTTQKSRNSLYKTLSKTGNPYFVNLREIVEAMGFHLTIDIARRGLD